ncbi:MAG: hypothetical protein LBJ78_04215 [Puniceicoccales bacterium]|jgi:hypothetical protein|nr:hypothetical protein [Puniceicoccales bacterium]
MKHVSVCVIGIGTLLLSGCQTTKVGPRALKSSHSAYNQALITTLDEQLLTNIVRLRYRDNPVFLEANTITQSNKASGSLGLEFSKTFLGRPSNGAYNGTGGIKPSMGCEDGSQIVLKPLTGNEFIKKLMTPIQNPILISMIQSGWRADRVFNLCVERINNLYNAPTASGPTPTYAPEYAKFYRFTELLRTFQRNNLINFGEQPDVNFADLMLRVVENPLFAKEIKEFKTLANLNPNLNEFKFKSSFLEMSPKKLTIRARSLLGIFFFLSQGVEVPKEDETQGLVTVTQNLDGSKFDWNTLSTRFLTIHCSTSKIKPNNAYVACHYRNRWFFIADNDLESKTSFMLLNQIFTLQSSKYKASDPILVLSGS